MYVCMYACLHVCMHVCMCVCAYVCMHVCMHACMYVCTCTHACTEEEQKRQQKTRHTRNLWTPPCEGRNWSLLLMRVEFLRCTSDLQRLMKLPGTNPLRGMTSRPPDHANSLAQCTRTRLLQGNSRVQTLCLLWNRVEGVGADGNVNVSLRTLLPEFPHAGGMSMPVPRLKKAMVLQINLRRWEY